MNHQRQLELEGVYAAARQQELELHRPANAPRLAEPPSEQEQMSHRLTHLPYQPWCESCVAFRARMDRHQRDDSARRSGTPTISFDLAFTKAVPQGEDPQRSRTLMALIMVCSQTGYIGCCPIKQKNSFTMMTRELIAFTSLLGHSEVVYMCDNEPTMRQLLRMVVNTRLKMGLATRTANPPAYSHGNSLCENTVERVRSLAGSLMHNISLKLNVEFSTNNPLWSWAFRHACWLLNRYNPSRGVTAFELVHSKDYRGAVAEFGEPVFGYCRSSAKGSPRWRRVLFLGKIDPQDSYLLFDGSHLILAKSIRRISTSWKGYLPFYVNFKCCTWDYKSMGGRIVPTKVYNTPKPIILGAPGEIEPSAFFDEEAEAVRLKAEEERREELELKGMEAHDRGNLEIADESQQHLTLGAAEIIPLEIEDYDDNVQNEPSSASGLNAPQTPVDIYAPPASASAPAAPPTPRTSSTTRLHESEAMGSEDDPNAKRAKVESAKKQRLERISAEYVSMIRSVNLSDYEVYTMDNYDDEAQMDDDPDPLDPWQGEEELVFTGVPEELWNDGDVTIQPIDPPKWIDRMADKVEIERLCKMGVLQLESEYSGDSIQDSLTTRFVYDWRVKDYTQADGTTCKRWLRRSRCVAREYAFLEKRDDTYSPATSTHILNLLPMLYLQCDSDDHVLATVDVKDAFLQVPQPSALRVKLNNTNYAVLKNLPGQRLGAKSWYWFFRSFLQDKLGMEFFSVQPCLCRNEHCALAIHVDDVMYFGSKSYWHNIFLPTLMETFSISQSVLDGIGSSISFLKRKIKRVDGGLALIPGTNVMKLVKMYEDRYGHVRPQTTPADASLQMEDSSPSLTSGEATFFRAAVGVCLYLSRDRPDIVFTVKELASRMSNPTTMGIQCLKRLIGYLKSTKDYAVVLEQPQGGSGKWKQMPDRFWILESYSDSDWCTDRRHRRSTSSGMHLLNRGFMYGSSRTQKVVALSSCEAELHGMVSTLADGIFIKRCAEFLTGSEVNHVLFTDSSSARQLVQKQGTGKVKHVAAKILWIQDFVREGTITLTQIPTAMNVADIATKCLAAKRLRLLGHELGLSFDGGHTLVGELEYEEQLVRNNSKRVAKMSQVLARTMLLMGLGPGGAMSQRFPVSSDQCLVVEVPDESSWPGLGVIAVIFLALVLWCGFAFYVVKRLKELAKESDMNTMQILDMDDTYDRVRLRMEAVERQSERSEELSNRLQSNVNSLSENIEWQSDYAENLHYGLVQVGGYTPFHELTPDRHRHMYALERGNIVARNVMGSDRFLALIRQQNLGIDMLAEPTDDTHEGAEEERPMEVDETVEIREVPTVRGHINNLIQDLRGKQNDMLAQHDYREASDIQHVILAALDVIHVHGPIAVAELWRLKDFAADVFQSIGMRMQLNDRPEMYQMFRALANEYRIRDPGRYPN